MYGSVEHTEDVRLRVSVGNLRVVRQMHPVIHYIQRLSVGFLGVVVGRMHRPSYTTATLCLELNSCWADAPPIIHYGDSLFGT
jgi:hypothetical protein